MLVCLLLLVLKTALNHCHSEMNDKDSMPDATYLEWMKRARTAAANDILFQNELGPRALRARHGRWKSISVLDGPDTEVAKRELIGGADGFVLTTTDSVAALRDLPLHQFAMRNETGDAGALALTRLIAQQPIDPARLDISFGLQSAGMVKGLVTSGFMGPYLEVSETDAGLGAVLASAVLLLRHLDFLHGEQLSAAITVKLYADQNMFKTLAKFRAMRILWARILSECKLPDAPLKLHGQTAPELRVAVGHEHYMLRAVSACLGAGIGGADSFTVLPHQNDGIFERRMARNIQTILVREAHVAHVADAAAGAGYLEHLTRQICEQAWSYFQKQETSR